MKTLLLTLLFLAILYADAPKELRVGVYDNAPKIFVDANSNPSGFFHYANFYNVIENNITSYENLKKFL